MKSPTLVRPLLFVLVCALPALAGEWPKHMDVYRGTTPKLDGVIEPNEYKDATVFYGMKGWNPQFPPATSDANDLSLVGYVKHDGHNLYFAFDVTDDTIYGIDTPRWAPAENPDHVHDLTTAGFPWFGDGVELLINADNKWPKEDNTYNSGDGRSWQVVCNTTKSLLGGIGKGGLIQGEQRDNPVAWPNYERWIRSGAMQAVVKIKPNRKGYVIEWMIKPAPCLEVAPGKFWDPKMGTVKMGLNIGIQDLDQKERGNGNWGNFHHEDWWAGQADKRTWPKQWGTMTIHPGTKDCRAACTVNKSENKK